MYSIMISFVTETTGPISQLVDNLSPRRSSTELFSVSLLVRVLYHWGHHLNYLKKRYQLISGKISKLFKT